MARTRFLQTLGLLGSMVLGAAVVIAVAAILMSRSSAPATPSVIGAAASAVPAAPVSGIEDVPDARAAAHARLAALPGPNCQSWVTHFVVPPPDIDARIIGVGGPDRWLKPRVWVGDVAGAVRAWDARWAAKTAAESNEVWVEIVAEGGATQEVGLRAFRSPAGHLSWHVAETAQLVDCP